MSRASVARLIARNDAVGDVDWNVWVSTPGIVWHPDGAKRPLETGTIPGPESNVDVRVTGVISVVGPLGTVVEDEVNIVSLTAAVNPAAPVESIVRDITHPAISVIYTFSVTAYVPKVWINHRYPKTIDADLS
jgi:hypothetical protein